MSDEHKWRRVAQVASHWSDADAIDPSLLAHKVSGPFWELLDAHAITLLVTREYEHFVLALACIGGRPRMSYLPMPHPSGLAVDRAKGQVHLASTRNPNQIFDLVPGTHHLADRDSSEALLALRPLLPVRSRMLPGALYLHDLAMISGSLHANAVGENAVIQVQDDGTFSEAWWPRCIERDSRPVFERNHIQLNSIAAGASLGESFFTASSESISTRTPGQATYPVDRRGVVFSGATRERIATGLTRPHSARLRGDQIWVDNSGYGELVVIDGAGGFDVVSRLPGWTRGLSFHDDLAFVGTSRVIPRFAQYAPGLDPAQCRCAVHLVAAESGGVLASISWPQGNQIFGLEWIPTSMSAGFPFGAGQERPAHRKLFSTFLTDASIDARRPDKDGHGK